MSALGDYVHYHKDNYKRWGTSKVNRAINSKSDKWSPIPNASYLRDSEKTNLIMEAKYLEDEYNKLFYPSEAKVSEKTNEFRKNLEEIIQSKLDKEFGSVAGSFNIESLSVDTNALYSELNNAIKETKDRLGVAITYKNNTAKSLLKQVELMSNILNQQEFKNIAEIQSRLEEAKGQLNNIKTHLLSEISASGENVKVQNIEDVQTLSSIIQEFNRVPLLYKQNRAVFEWLAPFIKLQTTSIAKKELAETMKSLASSNIKVDIDSDEIKRYGDISFDSYGINVRTVSSDNNSQIAIEYKDSQGIMQKQNILAKNIKTGSTEIQLFNSTSLYQLLSLSNIYNFANHYLNVVTSAPGQTSKEADIIMMNRELKGSILSTFINNNKNTIKFLVINDYKKRKIFVYSIQLLLYMIRDALLWGDGNKYSNIITLENDYTIPNNWEDTVATRIGKVLINTRHKKVSGIITPGMFSVYKNALATGKP